MVQFSARRFCISKGNFGVQCVNEAVRQVQDLSGQLFELLPGEDGFEFRIGHCSDPPRWTRGRSYHTGDGFGQTGRVGVMELISPRGSVLAEKNVERSVLVPANLAAEVGTFQGACS